jgi:hypothetical protein
LKLPLMTPLMVAVAPEFTQMYVSPVRVMFRVSLLLLARVTSPLQVICAAALNAAAHNIANNQKNRPFGLWRVRIFASPSALFKKRGSRCAVVCAEFRAACLFRNEFVFIEIKNLMIKKKLF